MRNLFFFITVLLLSMSVGAQSRQSALLNVPAKPQAVIHEQPRAQIQEMQMRAPGTPVVRAPKKTSNVDLWYRRPAGAFPGALVVEDGEYAGMYYAPYICLKPYADYTFLGFADGCSDEAIFEWDVQSWGWNEDSTQQVRQWITVPGKNLTWHWGLETDSVPVYYCIEPDGFYYYVLYDYVKSDPNIIPITVTGVQQIPQILSVPNTMDLWGIDILVSSKAFIYYGRNGDQRYPMTYYSGAEPYPGNDTGWWFGKNGYHYIDNPRYVIDGIAQAFEKPEHPYRLNYVALDCGVLEVTGQCEMQCRIYKLDEIPAYNDTTDVYLPEEPGELIAKGRATLTPGNAETTGDLVFFTLYGEEDGLEYDITPTIDCAILICIDGYNDPEMANLADFSAMICSDDEVDEGFGELAYLKFGYVDEDGDVSYVWDGLNNFFSSGSMKTGLTIFLSTEMPYLTFNYNAEDAEYTFPVEGGLMEKQFGSHTTRSIEFWTSVPSADDTWRISCETAGGGELPEWLSIELTDKVEDGEFSGVVNAEVVADPLPEGVAYREAVVRFEFPGAYVDYKFMQGILVGPVRGDFNHDGEVNIADLNYLLGWISDGIDDGQLNPVEDDLNGDGEINIADVNALIDIILQ